MTPVKFVDFYWPFTLDVDKTSRNIKILSVKIFCILVESSKVP